MLCSLFKVCIFFLAYSAFMESLCVNKRFVEPDQFWMQIRSPYYLKSFMSGGFLCPGMVFTTQGVVAVKLCLNFFVSPLLLERFLPAHMSLQTCPSTELWPGLCAAFEKKE